MHIPIPLLSGGLIGMVGCFSLRAQRQAQWDLALGACAIARRVRGAIAMNLGGGGYRPAGRLRPARIVRGRPGAFLLPPSADPWQAGRPRPAGELGNCNDKLASDQLKVSLQKRVILGGFF